jgi:hypothetical protein
MVEAARQLGVTIGRFKVHRRDANELARSLEQRRQEMRSSLKALLDMADVATTAGPSSRLAAELLLEDLQELTSSAEQRILRQAGAGEPPAGEEDPGAPEPGEEAGEAKARPTEPGAGEPGVAGVGTGSSS